MPEPDEDEELPDRAEVEAHLVEIERALDADPDSASLHAAAAEALVSLADIDLDEDGSGTAFDRLTQRAALHLARACGLEPEASEHRQALAWALHDLGLHDLQLVELMWAVRLAPDDPSLLVELAHALDHADRRDEAVDVLGRALPLADIDLRHAVREKIAVLKTRSADRVEGIAELERLVEEAEQEDRPAQLEVLAGALLRDGRTDEAIAALREAANLSPGGGADSRVGEVLLSLGRVVEAADHFSREADQDDADWEARCALAESLAILGRNEDAWERLAQAEAIAPDEAGPQVAWARALLTAEMPEDALAHARLAVEREPWLPEHRRVLAAVLDALGRTDEASSERRQTQRLGDGR